MTSDVPAEDREPSFLDGIEASDAENPEELTFVPGLFHHVTEVSGGDGSVYEFGDHLRIEQAGARGEVSGLHDLFGDVALSFAPAAEDSDGHELALVPSGGDYELSKDPDEDALLRLLDRSLLPARDIAEVKSYHDKLKKAEWRIGTSGLFVVARDTRPSIGSYEKPHIAAQLVGFIFHEKRATIEPVVMGTSNAQVGLLPVDFSLSPRWLYRTQEVRDRHRS